jgi:adenosylcobinamide-phosphate synthase
MGFTIGKIANWCPQDRPALEFLFGAGLVVSGGALFTLPWVLLWLLQPPLYWLLAIPLLKITFSIRGLQDAGKAVQTALVNGDLAQARQTLHFHLVGRDTSALNPELVTSATIESLAENITDGVTSPLFYFVIGGVPAAWLYRFVNTCDSMLGYRDRRREYLGKFAARADDILNWLPARLTALSIIAAAWLTGANSRSALRTMLSQHNRAISPNAGWTMAAMAGALGITLTKLGQYELEGGSGSLDQIAIGRCLRLSRVAIALLAVLHSGLLGIIYAFIL